METIHVRYWEIAPHTDCMSMTVEASRLRERTVVYQTAVVPILSASSVGEPRSKYGTWS